MPLNTPLNTFNDCDIASRLISVRDRFWLAPSKTISNSLISCREEIFEGKCNLCREKDRKAFIKKQAEQKAKKRKAEESNGDEQREEVDKIMLTIRDVKKEMDSEHSDGASTTLTTPEEPAPGTKLLEQFPPPGLPNGDSKSPEIKMENEDGTFSFEKYEKWRESAMDAAKITKKQKTEVAGIGSWVPVKWVAVSTKKEDEDDADSATGGFDSTAHAKTESSEFTFGMGSGLLVN